MTKEEIIKKIDELGLELDNAGTIGEALRLTRSIKLYEQMLDELEKL